MAAKKRGAKRKKAAAKRRGKRKTSSNHGVHVRYGQPSPISQLAEHGETVKFTKQEKAARFVRFAKSPFEDNGLPGLYAIPTAKLKVVADNPPPNHQDSYPYDILDQNMNVVSKKGKSTVPNPPDIVVG